MQAKAEHGNERNSDLRQLEPLRHYCLVVTIGQFATQRREKEVWGYEDGSGERDECFRIGSTDLEQNQKYQCILEKIVTEGGKELGPEKGREAPRHEQGRRHGFPMPQLNRWPPHSLGWVARLRNPSLRATSSKL
jgi:hypothetical protein